MLGCCQWWEIDLFLDTATSDIRALEFIPSPNGVEANMRCFKAFGERIAANHPDRQTAEVHIRIALTNCFSALGTAAIVRVA